MRSRWLRRWNNAMIGFWRAKKPPGRRGEDLATRYLRRAGYRILERNVRLRRYEVDIIARDGDTIVFVEVRSRISADPVPPEDSVGHTKQAHLIAAARIYQMLHPDPEAYYRFDVVAVILPEKGRPEITLYKDAFQVP